MTEYWNDKWNSERKYCRKICPMCGATGKHLKEMDDLKRPLYDFGIYKRMYAKINVCKKCGYEWS